MRILKKNNLSVVIALVLALTIALPSISVFGQFDPDARISYSYAAASPNPAFLGQRVFVIGFVYPPPSRSGQLYGDFHFTITKPGGTVITKDGASNTQASAFVEVVADELGNWTVKMNFDGDLVQLDRLPSESELYTFEVIDGEFVEPEWTKLPEYLWSSPISSANYEWWRISGAWPKNSYNGYSNYNPYSTGPETSHILWRNAGIYNEGLLGGALGWWDVTRSHTNPYMPTNPIAWNNKMYYVYTGTVDSTMAMPYSNATMDNPTTRANHVRCLDMNTGETVWDIVLPYWNYTTGEIENDARTGTRRTIQMVVTAFAKGEATAQDYGRIPPGGNCLGCKSLWVSGDGLWKIDPEKGQVIWYQLEPELSPTYCPDTMCWYINNYPVRGNLTCINAIEDVQNPFPPDSLYPVYNQYGQMTYPGCIVWTHNTSQLFNGEGFSMNAVLEGYVIDLDTNRTAGTAVHRLKVLDALTGAEIAIGTYNNDTPDPGCWSSSGSNTVYGSGVYSKLCADGVTRAWSFETGSLLWESEPQDLPWGIFGTYDGTAGLGLVMSGSYAPYMYCYNATDGSLLWKQATNVLPDGTLNPYNYEYAENGPPTWGVRIISTNAVYYATGEHSPANPTQRGDALYANAHDGTLLWRLPYFKGNRNFYWAGVACEKMWMSNLYDSYMYMFGKGPSKTTVSVSQSPIVEGGATVIQGMVTDVSAATEELAVSSRYPDGVPAVTDESMDTWMAYLYTIGAEGPMVDLDDVQGVKVDLFAVGSDGTVIDIGDAQCDRNGFYSYMWEPPSADCLYTIIAGFDGGKSYFPSWAETAVGITAAPEAPPEPEPEEEAAYTAVDLAIIAAVVIAIVIGLVNLWALRKK